MFGSELRHFLDAGHAANRKFRSVSLGQRSEGVSEQVLVAFETRHRSCRLQNSMRIDAEPLIILNVRLPVSQFAGRRHKTRHEEFCL